MRANMNLSIDNEVVKMHISWEEHDQSRTIIGEAFLMQIIHLSAGSRLFTFFGSHFQRTTLACTPIQFEQYQKHPL